VIGELGDPAVCEAIVGAGCVEAFFQGLVVVGELAEALLERNVLGGCPLGAVSCGQSFQIADLAHEECDVVPLSAYFGMGCLSAVPPGCLLLGIAAGLDLSSAPSR
jgi:hypothetical protein